MTIKKFTPDRRYREGNIVYLLDTITSCIRVWRCKRDDNIGGLLWDLLGDIDKDKVKFLEHNTIELTDAEVRGMIAMKRLEQACG